MGAIKLKLYFNPWQHNPEHIEYQIEQAVSSTSSREEIEIVFAFQLELRASSHIRPRSAYLIEKNRLQVTVITILQEPELERDLLLIWPQGVPENVRYMSWWSYFLARSCGIFELESNLDHETPLIENSVFTAPYLCYMHKVRHHRDLLVDELCKHNILADGIVTYWRDTSLDSETGAVPWQDQIKYYDFSVIGRDNGYIENSMNSLHLTPEYFQGFLNCVVETDEVNIGITEKTVTPLITKRPFLILGPQRINQFLQSKGFKLYDDVFDYAFDDEPDMRKRVEMYAQNIKRVTENPHMWTTWYKQLKPKIEHNYNLAWNIARYSRDIPETILNHWLDRFTRFPQDGDYYDALVYFLKHKYGVLPSVLKYDIADYGPESPEIRQQARSIELMKKYIPEKKHEVRVDAFIEWSPEVQIEYINAIKRTKSILVTNITSCDDLHVEPIMEGLSLRPAQYRVELWPTFYLYRTIFLEETISRAQQVEKDFSYNYINLNMQPHLHRCMLIDELYRRNLVDTNRGLVSWQIKSDYAFQYWPRNRIKTIGDDFENHKNSFVKPDEYYTSFVDVVTESTLEAALLSEKTAVPLYLGKPFLTFGCVNYSERVLKKLGFLLYDELFDYDFDKTTDTKERIKQFVDNVKRISNMTSRQCNEMYQTLKPKLEYNRQRAIQLAQDSSYIPLTLLDSEQGHR